LGKGRSSAYIESGSDILGIRTGANLFVDVDQFEATLRSAAGDNSEQRRRLLREAAELYTDDLLLSEPYLDWAIAARERLRGRYQQAILDLASLNMQAGEPEASIGLLKEIVEADRTDETAL
jgi:DNA-binding SARP family transcriptional activator